MRPRGVIPLTPEELESLTTERLLAYRNAMLRLEDSGVDSSWSESELKNLPHSKLYFKDDPRWKECYATLKRVLALRAHISDKN